MTDFSYVPLFHVADDTTAYRLVTSEHVSADTFRGREVLVVEPAALRLLAREAFHDIAFFLRKAHLEKVAAILDDPEASANDRGVAAALLRNAAIAAEGVLPMCQDTGTATVVGWKGEEVFTGCDDVELLSQGVFDTYTECNLRYSQNIPKSLFVEQNSRTNLPAQVDLYAAKGAAYRFLFVAKGGGSANKMQLFQETKAVLNPDALVSFLVGKMRKLGTAACPPYHVAFVVGGTSAETCMKTVKLASTGYLDGLPTQGGEGSLAFRDQAMEGRLLEEAYRIGLGAQFGGKHFALDVRLIRMPRHGASCPIGMAVSCSADRNALARIDKDGIWLEELERNPGRFLPDAYRERHSHGAVEIDLNQPMEQILAELTKHPITTEVRLTGPMIVARDIAHARLKERLDRGEGLPGYLKDHPVYYAGPAKTPEGMASGSFGPTTAQRMDPYVEPFQAEGASLVMLAKGNRSQQVVDACKKHGGFYLGSIGGPAALIAKDHIKKVEVIEFPEIGMEAVHRIEVEDFPAFILIDDKGNDFFARVGG